jgi:hypothetical protein
MLVFLHGVAPLLGLPPLAPLARLARARFVSVVVINTPSVGRCESNALCFP